MQRQKEGQYAAYAVRLRGGLQVVSKSAVATAVAEEALRLKPPAKLVFRKAVRDTALAGIRVPAGTSVMCHIVQVSSRLQLPSTPLHTPDIPATI